MTSRDRYFILSVDGGGCRGVIPAMLLQSLGDDLLARVDMLAGTSTGAILAGGLAAGVGIDAIANVYRSQEANRTIFTPSAGARIPLVGKFLFPRYSADGVRKVVGQFAEVHRPLSSLTRTCVLPAFIIDHEGVGGPQWLATAFHNLGPSAGLGGFGEVSTLEAILASAAAPVFFPPHKIGPQLFVDGGVMATNPALVALAAATHAGIIGRRGVPLDRVSMLSLGTGQTMSGYPPEPADAFLPPFGMLGWMWPEARGKDTPPMPVMGATSDGVAQLNDYQVRSILGDDDYRRAQIDFGATSFPMDAYQRIEGPDGLMARTERYMATDEWKEIKAWVRARLT